SSRGQPRARGPSRRRRQRPVGPRGVGGRPMAHLLSRSHPAPSRAGSPPGVDAGRCERPAPSSMTKDLQFVHYVPRPKGTISEFELVTMRNRLERGRLHKARRGELFHHVPLGYVKLSPDRVDLDPDEQVRDVIRLVFDKYDEIGSVWGVFHYLVRNNIRLGIRPFHGPNRGHLEWRRPTMLSVRQVLTHPMYAGAYSFGRRPHQRVRTAVGERTRIGNWLPMEQWK